MNDSMTVQDLIDLAIKYLPKGYYITSEYIPKFTDNGNELIYQIEPSHSFENHILFMFHPDWLPKITEGWAKNGIMAVDQRKVWEEDRKKAIDVMSAKK